MKKVTTLLFYLVVFGVIEAVIFNFFYQNKTNKEKLYLDNKIEQLEAEYRAVTNSYSLVSKTIFNGIIDRPEVIDIFKVAHSADEDAKKVVRDELFKNLNPVYENLKQFNLRQLHFHLPNGDSFLRFHKPGKFGDNLLDVRYSVKLTNMKKIYTEGFEEGRIYNGFRYVFPMFDQNKTHIGSVETSVSFSAIRNEMNRIFQANYFFVIKRDVVDEKVFKDEKNSNYKASDISPDYLYDKEVSKSNYHISEDVRQKLNMVMKKEMQDNLKEDNPFAIVHDLDNQFYIVSFIPIFNLEKKKVAYIFSYAKDNTLGSFKDEFKMNLIGSTLLLILLFAFIVSVNRNRALSERRRREIESLNKNLEEKIAIKTRALSISERYYRQLLDSQSNLVLVQGPTSGLIDANKSFFQFFNIRTVGEFREKFSDISNFFENIDKDGYLYKTSNINWVNYVIGGRKKSYRVAITKDNILYVFKVTANKILHEGMEKIVVTFTDISDCDLVVKEAKDFQGISA